MRIVELNEPHRRKHFDFFRGMSHPHFQIVAPVEITALRRHLRDGQLPFTPSIVYLLSLAANQLPTFRQRLRGEQLVEHEIVHPSFTVLTDVSDVFSFCTVAFSSDYADFTRRAAERIEAMRRNPNLEDEEGRDDYLFLSAIPWVSFTGFQHAMNYHPHDSVPRIVWGKYYEENGRIRMPLAVQAHHAVVDGRHIGEYFQLIDSLAADPSAWAG
ncbi:MAG: chloramphenicol acetyltransferase [Saprospiraceae bacterium]|nr:chloramphenicol acetyltransferase [Saprospiraceae bacterium]MCB0678779.1 chloramphenicol acetyltransferase [Saprospiraceae bacterium]